MHPRIIAQRQSTAHKRVLEAVAQIAANTGIDAPDLASIREKSPDVQRIKEWEMLADWVEGLAKKTKPTTAKAKAKEADDAKA